MTKKKPVARTSTTAPQVRTSSDLRSRYFSYFSQVARAIVGAVLVFSAATKLLHPVDFALIVQHYELLPSALVDPLATVLPWIELLVGGFIFVGLFSRFALPIGGAMMIFFIGMMGIAFAQGKNIDCGCFVGVVSDQVGPVTLVRDLVILALAVPAYLGLPHKFSLEMLMGSTTARLRFIVAPLALVIVTIALGVTLGSFAADQQAPGPAQLAAQTAFPAANGTPPNPNSAAVQTAAPAPSPTGGAPVALPPTAPARHWRLGPETAKVVITEYGDYQCPACKTLAPILKKLVDDYRGDVSLVYRHFPLPNHPLAVPAALAAEAAGEQGKFWEMHELMYADQQRLAPQDLLTKAAYLKLDMQRFEEAVRSERVLKRVQSDYDDGIRSGLKYTPWILVNDKLVQANSLEAIKAAIDSALKK